MKTAYCLICTGRYKELFKGFYDSFRVYMPDDELFVFTDDCEFFNSYKCTPLLIEHKPWPYIVMNKYTFFINNINYFADFDEIISLQANMRFINKPNFVFNELMFCFHPWNGEVQKYICGGLVGGKRNHFFNMAKIVQDYLNANPNLQWHDETALNWFWKTHNPKCDILPSYTMYAEEKPETINENTCIMLKDKVKFFHCRKSQFAR